jgi:hypothetical protein
MVSQPVLGSFEAEKKLGVHTICYNMFVKGSHQHMLGISSPTIV